jgi:hypothetical protein
VLLSWTCLMSLLCSRQKRAQLGEDAGERAGNDANYGGHEAADNRKTANKTHKNHFAFCGRRVVDVLWCR